MSLGATMAADALDVLLEIHGETVTLGDASYTALIDRLPIELPGGPDSFRPPQRSTIKIAYSQLTTRPSREDILTDAYGVRHTIEQVRYLGHAWEMECISTFPTSE